MSQLEACETPQLESEMSLEKCEMSDLKICGDCRTHKQNHIQANNPDCVCGCVGCVVCNKDLCTHCLTCHKISNTDCTCGCEMCLVCDGRCKCGSLYCPICKGKCTFESGKHVLGNYTCMCGDGCDGCPGCGITHHCLGMDCGIVHKEGDINCTTFKNSSVCFCCSPRVCDPYFCGPFPSSYNQNY